RCGGAPGEQITAPASLQFTLPMPIALRAVQRGEPRNNAVIELLDRPEGARSSRLTRVLLFAPTVAVRARCGDRRSPLTTLLAEQAGSTIDLELADQLATVSIEFTGGHGRQAPLPLTPSPGAAT